MVPDASLRFMPCMHTHTQGIRVPPATAAGNAERGDMPSVQSSFATANQTMAVAAMPSYMGKS